MSPRRTPPAAARAFKRQRANQSARAARAAALAYRLITGGAVCAGSAMAWNEAEHAYRVADSLEAEQAASQVLSSCSDCPVRQLCGEWAAIDRYDGFAAGTHWYVGQPTTKPVSPIPMESRAA